MGQRGVGGSSSGGQTITRPRTGASLTTKLIGGKAYTFRSQKTKKPSQTQIKQAKWYTPEAQQREFGRVIIQTKPKLTATQLKRARSFTEQEQINRFGRIVSPQTRIEAISFGKGAVTRISKGVSRKLNQFFFRQNQETQFILNNKKVSESEFKKDKSKGGTFTESFFIDGKKVTEKEFKEETRDKTLRENLRIALNDSKIILKKVPNWAKRMLKGSFDISKEIKKKGTLNKKEVINLVSATKNTYLMKRIIDNNFNRKLSKQQATKINNTLNNLQKKVNKDVKNLKLKSNANLIKTEEAKLTKKWVIGFGRGLLDFSSDIGKGLVHISGAIKNDFGAINDFFSFLINAKALDKLNKKVKKEKRGYTKQEKDIANRLLNKIKNDNNKIKSSSEKIKKATELLNKEESELARDIGVLASLGVAVTTIGGVTATIGGVVLGTIGLVATTLQGFETIKEPTPRNFGRLAFFAAPTGIAVLKVIRKLSPRFRPTVKNVGEAIGLFKERLKKNNLLLDKVNGLLKKKKLQFFEKRKLKKTKSLLEKQNEAFKQGLKEFMELQKDSEILKARDFNPHIHTKFFKKLQGSYRDALHVSADATAGKSFGKNVEKVIDRKGIQELLRKTEITQKTILPDIKTKVAAEKELLRLMTHRQGILTGGRAIQLQTSTFKRLLSGRKKSVDFDFFIRNPRMNAIEITKLLNGKFKTDAFTVKPARHKGTYKILFNNREFADFTILKKGTKFITTKTGLRVEPQKKLLARKIKAALKRTGEKGRQDVTDIEILTRGDILKSDLTKTVRVAKDEFIVQKMPFGAGKERMKFGEFSMFFDIEAPLSYAYGNKFLIIKFPKIRIAPYPKSLRLRITKASKGLLNSKQGIKLRMDLNKYVNSHPNRFFISPRTASLTRGEREIIIAVDSRFFKNDIYKTFDNDAQKFIDIIGVGFRKQKSKSLFRKFLNSWKNKPFKALKLRLTNPDILEVRKIRRLLKKDIKLKHSIAQRFINIFKRFLKSKKAELKIPSKTKKKKVRIKRKKLTIKEIVKRRKQATKIRRRVILLKRRVKKRTIKKRRKVRKTTRERIRKRERIRERIIERKRERIRERKRTRERIIERKRERIRERKRTRERIIKKVKKIKRKRIKRIKLYKQPEAKILEKKLSKNIHKKFIYISDLQSRIFGFKALTKAKKKELLRTGRVFTGAEVRKLLS